MRHILTTIGILGASVAAYASASQPHVGSYRLITSPEVKTFCERYGLPLPVGKLNLRNDGTFILTVTDDEGVHRTMGRYDILRGILDFRIEQGDGLDLPREMRLTGSDLIGYGASYRKVKEQTPMRPSSQVAKIIQSVPAMGAARPKGSVDIPIAVPTHSDNNYAVRTDSPKSQVPITGQWNLIRNGREEKDTRFVFNSDGTFRFSGQNSTSKGRYLLGDDYIELHWSEIDGQSISSTQRVTKRLPIEIEGRAFYVDAYRYERSR